MPELEPITRREKYLNALSDETQEIPEPVTREEMFLKRAIDSGGGSSLPEVTSEDNGKVLGVVEGAWDKMDAPSDGSTVLVTGYRRQGTQNVYILEKTQQEICEMIKGGKDVVILIEENKESIHNYERRRFVCTNVLGTIFYFINFGRSPQNTFYYTFSLDSLNTSNSVSYTFKNIADPA